MIPLPEHYIELMQRTPQNPKYHAEGNVYIHTIKVLEQFHLWEESNSLSKTDYEVLYWACILHDIGKPFVTTWKEDRWTAKGHEEAGVPHSRDILLGQKEISLHQRLRILNLVRWHHIPLNWNKVTDTILAGFSTMLNLRELALFGTFDIGGRDCQDKEKAVTKGRLFMEDIVPKIETESGSFDFACRRYGEGNLKQKNALWNAYRINDPTLWKKLLYAQYDEPMQPAFQCILPIGIPSPQKWDFLQSLYPNAFFLPVKGWGIEGKLPEVAFDRQRILTTFKHHLSQYARNKRTIILVGDNLFESTRSELSSMIKSLQGRVTSYFFDIPLENIINENLAQTTPLPEPEIRIAHRMLRYPHPWEAHEWFVVTNNANVERVI